MKKNEELYLVLPYKVNMVQYNCKECGTLCQTKTTSPAHLARLSGKCRSCSKKGKPGNITIKHGGTGTRLYDTWRSMKKRCSCPNRSDYHHYGGRGITFCEDWNEFAQFRDWALNNGYSENLTLDRINANGNYEPSNCRWATAKEQSINRRSSLEIGKGIKLTTEDVKQIKKLRNDGKMLKEIASLFNVSFGLISHICSGRIWNEKKTS